MAIGFVVVCLTGGDDRAVEVTSTLVARGESERRVEIRNVRYDAGTVAGELANHTADEVRNVRVLMTDTFLWTDERHPGPDDPSRGRAVTVAGPIAPGATLAFSESLGPRPDRHDGHFVLRVTLLGLAQQPLGP